MPRSGWPDEAVTDIAARRDALRQSAGLPGADLRTLVDAALTELDAAIEAAGALPEAAGGRTDQAAEVLPESVRAERRLLHAVFQQAPVPLFLLEQDGTIRRANNKAAELLGAPSGYATGKTLAAFIDLPGRAAVQTQLAAALRTGKPRTASCRILTADGSLDAVLPTCPATRRCSSSPRLRGLRALRARRARPEREAPRASGRSGPRARRRATRARRRRTRRSRR
jgi:PAS domain S-box-containing protein